MDQPRLSLHQIISLIFLIGLLFFIYQSFYKEKNTLIKASEFDSIGMNNTMSAAMLNHNTYYSNTFSLDQNPTPPSSFSGLSAYNTYIPPAIISLPISPTPSNFYNDYLQISALTENQAPTPTSFSPTSLSPAASFVAYDPYVCPGFLNHSYSPPILPATISSCNSNPKCFWNSSDNICLKKCEETRARVVCQSRFRYCKYLLKSIYSCVAHYQDQSDNIDYTYTCGPANSASDYCYPATYTKKGVCFYSTTSSGACAASDDHPDAESTCKALKDDKAKCDLNSDCVWYGNISAGCNGPSSLCPNNLTKTQCEAVTLPSSSNTCQAEKIGTEETCFNK